MRRSKRLFVVVGCLIALTACSGESPLGPLSTPSFLEVGGCPDCTTRAPQFHEYMEMQEAIGRIREDWGACSQIKQAAAASLSGGETRMYDVNVGEWGDYHNNPVQPSYGETHVWSETEDYGETDETVIHEAAHSLGHDEDTARAFETSCQGDV
jgi:hypothetical protein